MRWSSYRTPYAASVRRYARGTWVSVRGQRAPRRGVITFVDPPGRQAYRVFKGATYTSRRVVL